MMSFLETERVEAGWRFFLIWVLATNLSFFIGISIEVFLFGQATLYVAILLAAFAQAWSINRHISIYLPWAIGTIIFWYIGAMIASQILSMMQLGADMLLLRLVIISAIGGLLAGIPQWFFMRDWLEKIGIWWIAVSGVAWAILIPGLVTGVVLMQFVTTEKVSMTNRRYELSGEF